MPYSFPNVTATTGKVVVRIPLGAGYANSGDVTLTLPTGVHDLTEIAQTADYKLRLHYIYTSQDDYM